MMKLFIWDYVTLETNAYHDSGSVIAIAETEDRARQLVAPKVKDFDGVEPSVYDIDTEMYDVFPYEGCC